MKKILLTFVIGFLLVPFCGIPRAGASEGGIQISPLILNLDITPLETKQQKISITNLNPISLNYVIEVELFSSVTDEGAPSFAGVTKPEGVTTLVDWVSIDPKDQQGEIKPNETKEINCSITIPQGAEPGGHYAAIFAKEIKKNPSGQTQLGVSSRVGTLLLVTVPGDVSKTAEIVSLNYPKIVWGGPVNFEMVIKNTGSVHYDSKAAIELQPLFGSLSSINLGTHTIIPKNSRLFSGQWLNKYPFGYYKLNAKATDGTGQEIVVSSAIWAIPLIIIVPGLAAIILIIVLIKYLKRHLRFVNDKSAK